MYGLIESPLVQFSRFSYNTFRLGQLSFSGVFVLSSSNCRRARRMKSFAMSSRGNCGIENPNEVISI